MVLHHDVAKDRHEVIEIDRLTRNILCRHRTIETIVEVVATNLREIVTLFTKDRLHKLSRILYCREITVTKTLVDLYI